MTKADNFSDIEGATHVGNSKDSSLPGQRHVRTTLVETCRLAARYIKDNHYILTMVLVFILSGMFAVLLGD